MKSNLLTFCIPTYNRSEILEEGILDLISKIGKYNFQIIVTDNSSIDNTEQVVNNLQTEYNFITYLKNEINLGADENFAISLKASKSKFTWLLGDSYRLIESELEPLLSILDNNNYDLVLVNSFNMINQIDTREYDDADEIIKDLGWYLPQMSAYIYNKTIISKANFKKFYNTNFLQMGISFDNFKANDTKVFWYSKNSVARTTQKKDSWHNEFLKVFARNWTEFILSLPLEITLKSKLQCIKMHGKKHKIFSVLNLVNYREKGWFNSQLLKQYDLYIPFTAMPIFPVAYLISKIPIKFLSMIKKLLNKQI
ncbi:hypothetical protein A5893_12150 [Pedobacter psychrophilus]|uniref:Glycosyltransferase 2-like domain-containing protein n=1 Tax=Pedobacter psychrophilus TaxID=1826909 RepID=A0A179DD06_9SPHI|nr:glycosyltransferase family 2 protein [Pedobacter psychrophilus]OAQ38794.1 hypothetical protein A5893_12150 [Pedobacter psychrophilus]